MSEPQGPAISAGQTPLWLRRTLAILLALWREWATANAGRLDPSAP